MSEITDSDYIKILEFYEKPIPKSKKLLKLEAETIRIEQKKIEEKRKPMNYTVVLDLSDRILLPNQLEKDF